MSEWEKEKIRQSTLYIESEPDDNDLNEYYKYNLEEEKKKREKHLDLDKVIDLTFVIMITIGLLFIAIGGSCGSKRLLVIGLGLIIVNMFIRGPVC